jgi:hypothetical protein
MSIYGLLLISGVILFAGLLAWVSLYDYKRQKRKFEQAMRAMDAAEDKYYQELWEKHGGTKVHMD